MRLCAAILFAAALFVRPLATADAGTALSLDVPDLAERADLIVEGHVLDARSEVTEGGLIVTAWDVSVERLFHGDAPSVVTLRLPGGVVGSIGMVIPGMPEMAPGEDVLLFVTEESHAGFRMPIGLGQGKYRIVTDLATGKRMLHRDAHDLELIGPSGHAYPASTSSSIEYADAVAEIHQGLARKEVR